MALSYCVIILRLTKLNKLLLTYLLTYVNHSFRFQMPLTELYVCLVQRQHIRSTQNSTERLYHCVWLSARSKRLMETIITEQ